jgi:hypothetical protein
MPCTPTDCRVSVIEKKTLSVFASHADVGVTVERVYGKALCVLVILRKSVKMPTLIYTWKGD